MTDVNGTRSSRQRLLLIIASIIAIVILAVTAGFFFWQYTNLKHNPDSAAQATTKRIVAKVGKIYALPKDEQPTVAEIKDKTKLSDQSFFKNAENGDYILVYNTSKLAILYNEKTHMLMNVGPISISSSINPKAN